MTNHTLAVGMTARHCLFGLFSDHWVSVFMLPYELVVRGLLTYQRHINVVPTATGWLFISPYHELVVGYQEATGSLQLFMIRHHVHNHPVAGQWVVVQDTIS
jgi:hypothetical protein